tara:strand:+ start:25 stop:942 length:918 start_codon:yes stop_codon:yes gene_type:complete
MKLKENKGNSKNRYRMSDFTARKIGIVPNGSQRYRLKKDQKKAFFTLDQAKIKRLFYDIETSQYEVRSFRIGYKLNLGYHNVTKLAKIICISWKWEGEDKIYNLKWDSKMCDKTMLESFINVLNKADEIVAHNGDRFDIKWIRTRALFHKIPMKSKYRSLDTLKKAKSNFNFPNNRLDTIAQFLGVGAKVEHDGMKMWDAVQDGDKEYLNEMVKYCDGDIVVLEDVYFAMQSYVINNTHVGTHNDKMKCSCPNCASEDISLVKNSFTALGTIKRDIKCNSCGYDYETSNSSWRTFLEMKQNNQIK